MTEQKACAQLPDLLPGRVPGIVWPPIPGSRQATLLALLFQMERSQWLSEAALRARQSLQLRELLAHARRHCRFYRDRLPADVTAWHAIPLLTRHDLQLHFDDLLADTYPRAHGKTFDISTGGSTGEPVTLRRTQLTQLFWEASTLRDHLWHRRDLSASMAITPTPIPRLFGMAMRQHINLAFEPFSHCFPTQTRTPLRNRRLRDFGFGHAVTIHAPQSRVAAVENGNPVLIFRQSLVKCGIGGDCRSLVQSEVSAWAEERVRASRSGKGSSLKSSENRS
ncbi:MAG: hypothetical protein JWM42_151 [Burkholderia sp.]|nr:hypothetical protein [Burkholderia sp.]